MGRNYKDSSGDKNPNYRHGFSKTKLNFIWSNMKARCLNKNHPKFHRYGGRGIKIASAWMTLKGFGEWAISNGYKDGDSLDRINNDGHYYPSNCQWVTKAQNSRKKRTTKISLDQACEIRKRISFGESEYDLAREYGVVRGTIWFIKNNFTHVPDGDCSKQIKYRNTKKEKTNNPTPTDGDE